MRLLLAGLMLFSSASFAEVEYQMTVSHDACINVCVTPDDSRVSGACLENWGPIVRGQNIMAIESITSYNTYYLSPQTDHLWLTGLNATIKTGEETTQNIRFNVFGMNLWACDHVKLTFAKPVQITTINMHTLGKTDTLAIIGDNI